MGDEEIVGGFFRTRYRLEGAGGGPRGWEVGGRGYKEEKERLSVLPKRNNRSDTERNENSSGKRESDNGTLNFFQTYSLYVSFT